MREFLSLLKLAKIEKVILVSSKMDCCLGRISNIQDILLSQRIYPFLTRLESKKKLIKALI